MSDSASMEDILLQKLIRILETNLENEKFGVKELSKEVGLSRSQLHRKLNKLTGKSISQYIREFRLEKAMEMLQNNVATVSEISYRVGFGSPTYFNTCFKEYFGYPPGEVKFRVLDNVEVIPNREDEKLSKHLTAAEIDYKNSSTTNNSRQKLILGAIIAILIIAVSVYYYNYHETSKPLANEVIKTEKSLAIMPFQNLSDNNDNQYFADGIRDDIINHLSKIQGVILKSKQSVDKYASDGLSGLDIREALGVEYIINGSVRKSENRIKIIVHLINAANDTHLWSKDFERQFDDIFQLESDISKEIANELNLVLSPKELQQITNAPTENVEAFRLYLQAKYLNGTYEVREKKYKESLAIDPEFALPYSGLSEMILNKNWPNVSQEDYILAKEYALKAISLDANLSDTHRVVGVIYMEYDWDWDRAEKELEQAILIDPNNAEAFYYYAWFTMNVKGDFKKSRELLHKCQLLAPLYPFAFLLSAENYMRTEDYDLVLEEANMALKNDPNSLWAVWLKFLAYIKKGYNDLAVKELEKSRLMIPNNENNIDAMLVAYKEEGINGIFRMINKMDIEREYSESSIFYQNAYFIAQKFAFLGEYTKAIKWLNLGFKNKSLQLFGIKYDHYFKDMRKNPDFLELLQKMNLGDYDSDVDFKD